MGFVLAKDKHGKIGKYLKNRGICFYQNKNMASFKKTPKGKSLLRQNVKFVSAIQGEISFNQRANMARSKM